MKLLSSLLIALTTLVCCHAGEIHDAVRKQDLPAVRKLLKQDPELVRSISYPDFSTPLYLAVSVGDPALVKCLLDAGAPMETRTPDFFRLTPLMRAVVLENEDFMKASQLFARANPENPEGPGRYPLVSEIKRMESVPMPAEETQRRLQVLGHLLATKPDLKKDEVIASAAFVGDPDVIRLLLDAGANANEKTSIWLSPLHLAAMRPDNSPVIERLVAAGADIEASNKFGQTPLMIAAICNAPLVVKSLIKHGAAVDAEDIERLSVIGYAAMSGNDEMVKIIHHAGDPELIRYAQKAVLMHRAAHFGSMELTRILLAEGVSIDQRDPQGFSPLLTAVEADHRDLAAFLLEKGADTRVRTKRGDGLFNIACMAGNIELAEKLLADGGWDADLENPQLLLDVVKGGSARGVEFVLKHGGDVNYRDPRGFTPLRAAILGVEVMKKQAPGDRSPPSEEEYSRIAELLLEHGARAEKTGADGQSPISLAAKFCGARVMKALLQAGGKAILDEKGVHNLTPLQIAVAEGRAETVKVMLDAGADRNVLLDTGHNLVHHAASGRNAATLKVLIDEGMPLGLRNPKDGSTALTYATLTNSPECVELLLNAGLTPNPSEASDNTPPPLVVAVDINISIRAMQSGRFPPWFLVQTQNLRDRLKLIHLLLAAGARTDIFPSSHKSLLHLAQQNGAPEIVELLESHQRASQKGGK